MVKIGIIGSGYVGLVTGVCLSDFGWQVICVDQGEELVKELSDGQPHIYEPGLLDMLQKNLYYKRISFTTDLKKAVQDSDVIFIAVGTPPDADGNADLTQVFEAARQIGRTMNKKKIIVGKSTVPVGTGKAVKKIIQEELNKRGASIGFDVVSNPEFLRQGSAIYDFTHADRVVIGAESDSAFAVMKEVYRVLYINETPFLTVNIETAELVKYASNAFLAAKISFVNELSALCEKTGANIQQIAKGMGMDGRIGAKFLHAGPGFGGSCLPKDTRALVETGRAFGVEMSVARAAINANERQKQRMIELIEREMGRLRGKVFCILGLAFKNNTDDLRESPALDILSGLSQLGGQFKAYDPKAMEKAAGILSQKRISVKYCKDEYEACADADALLLLTEWNQFRSLDLPRIKSLMSGDWFFDFRNIYSKEALSPLGFKYCSVGRP